MSDPYREWDAAYLLGALSPDERREYEAHLAGCPDCSADVAAMAGLPGVLSVVTAERALAESDAAPDLMPRLAAAAERVRRRARWRAAGLVAAAAAVAAIAVGVVPQVIPDETPARTVELAQTVPSPVRANARLVAEQWGTRIEATCSYDKPASGWAQQRTYGLYVTDRSGKVVRVATWVAAPGVVAEAYATTTLQVAQIAGLDIRSEETGKVLLKASL
jgi:anti-sigma-K factor RskA